jgi:hypothetical protein
MGGATHAVTAFFIAEDGWAMGCGVIASTPFR